MDLLLGSGSYGSVKVLSPKGLDNITALKTVELKDQNNAMSSFREHTVAMRVEHKNIVKTFWTRWTPTEFQSCMELGAPVTHGTCEPHKVLCDILSGLAWLHKCGYMHRDVKPENIIRVGEIYKLIDFGLAREMGGPLTEQTGYMASRWFRPIELLQDETDRFYDGRIDIWSLGCTVFFLQYGRYLYQGTKQEMLAQMETPSIYLPHMITAYDQRDSAERALHRLGLGLVEGVFKRAPYTQSKLTKCLMEGYFSEDYTPEIMQSFNI